MARHLRFGNIKVGDQLVLPPHPTWGNKIPEFYIVTDIWFDPVAGQYDPLSGYMIAIRRLDENGEPYGSKRAHTIRGLANARFQYPDTDYIAQCKASLTAQREGKVIAISRALTIRRRPKPPEPQF